MIITIMLVLLLASGLIAWYFEGVKENSARVISLVGIVLTLFVFLFYLSSTTLNLSQLTVVQNLAWIPFFNINYTLALDNLSVLLLLLTMVLAIICVLVSWNEIQHKSGFYYFNLLASIAGIIGVFTAIDLILFFFFWEVMLLPMTALIVIWGHENKQFAALKFFIFTQVSSLLMLIAIIATAYFHFQQTGRLSFAYLDWQTLDIPIQYSKWLMLGFFIAFAVKLPSVPVHSWLPDAHTQAPTAGSVLLAGVLLKTGAYGLIRFVILLFPQASVEFMPIAATLGVISVLYGAKMAFAQNDFKRLVAYSSISHMGFVMLALFSFNAVAYKGAVVTLVAHGLSSAALFAMAGMLYSRLHTRDLRDMGGLWHSAPRLGGFALAFAAAAFGLPGLVNFVGEFMSLVGAYKVLPIHVILAALGLIGSAIYGMVLFQKSFQGSQSKTIKDMTRREFLVHGSLFSLLLIFGLFPNLIIKQISVSSHHQVDIAIEQESFNESQIVFHSVNAIEAKEGGQ